MIISKYPATVLSIVILSLPSTCSAVEYSRETEASINKLFAGNSDAGARVLECLKSLPSDSQNKTTKSISTNARQLVDRGNDMITLNRRPYIAKALVEMDENLCRGATNLDRETMARKLLYTNIYTFPSPNINSLPIEQVALMICIRTYSAKLGFGGSTTDNLNTLSAERITLAREFCKTK